MLLDNRKRKKQLNFKKANLVTQGEDEVDFDDEEEKDKEPLLCPIALDDEITKVFNMNLSYFSDDDGIDDLYHELYESLIRAKKDSKMKTIENESLLKKNKFLEKEKYNLNLLVE